MRRVFQVMGLLVLLSAGPASAQALMDLDSVDPTMLSDFMGDWSIQNADGSKNCKVTLTSEVTIGGLEIDVDPDCAKVFPVMQHVASWRLYEDWEIVLVDATRKSLIRFTTPDNAYVADPDTDGIETIVKIGGSLEN
jgi:Protease inhibitor Inh